MSTVLKWVIPPIFIIVLVLGISYASSIQNINTNTMSEIEVLADTLSVGAIRSDVSDNGKVDSAFFDKDELIANLTAKVVAVQKNHPYDIHLDYVFFDEDGHVTDEEKDIRSIQFRLQYVDVEGDVKANAERHLAVNKLEN